MEWAGSLSDPPKSMPRLPNCRDREGVSHAHTSEQAQVVGTHLQVKGLPLPGHLHWFGGYLRPCDPTWLPPTLATPLIVSAHNHSVMAVVNNLY